MEAAVLDRPVTGADSQRSQALAALAKANDVRIRRANLRRRLQAGEGSVADLLAEEPLPRYLKTMPVSDLVRMQRRWGRKRTMMLLRSLTINPNRCVGDLTARQRQALIQHFRPTPHAG